MVREFRALRAGGVQEVSLIAQDLGDFGKDFGTGVSEIEVEKGEEVGGTSLSTLEADASPPVEGTPQLIKLLDHILASETASPGGSSSSPSDTQQHQQQQQPHVLPSYWLRLLYLYPDEITPQLLHVMASSQGRIAPYIDMPIQVLGGWVKGGNVVTLTLIQSISILLNDTIPFAFHVLLLARERRHFAQDGA